MLAACGETRIAAPVHVDKISVSMGALQPGIVLVVVEGVLADPCISVDDVRLNREAATFTVVLGASRPAHRVCPPVAVPFAETVVLDTFGLAPGRYTVTAQEASATFEVFPEESRVPTGFVERLSVSVDESRVVTLTLTGYLPDPCTHIQRVSQNREDRHFDLVLELSEPVEGECPSVIVPFGEAVVLETAGLEPGRYTVSAHGLTATFTLP